MLLVLGIASSKQGKNLENGTKGGNDLIVLKYICDAPPALKDFFK